MRIRNMTVQNDDADFVNDPDQKGFADSDVDVNEWDPADRVIWIPDLSSRTGFNKFWVGKHREEPVRVTGFRLRSGSPEERPKPRVPSGGRSVKDEPPTSW